MTQHFLEDGGLQGFVAQDTENAFVFRVWLQGPVGTVFEDGGLHLTVTFPVDYPFKPPRVSCPLFKCSHVHLADGETICLHCCIDCLPDWSPGRTLRNVLERINSLLLLVHPDRPFLAKRSPQAWVHAARGRLEPDAVRALLPGPEHPLARVAEAGVMPHILRFLTA